MEGGNEGKKPYVEPTLEKREKLIEITKGVATVVSGVATDSGD